MTREVYFYNIERRNTMERPELKHELFGLFTQAQQLSFDDIQKEVDQPRGFLQSVLDEICEKRKVRNKFLYNLKAEYLAQDDTGKPFKKLKT